MRTLIAVGVAVTDGCKMVGLARSSFYRLSRNYQHYRPVVMPMAHRDRQQPAALSAAECEVITGVLSYDTNAKLSVQQVFWRALDEGIVGCSERTFYRVAKMGNLVGDRRRRRTRGAQGGRGAPIVHTKKVGELWSWDITELRGPGSQRYKLYLAIDVFSRYPVAWRIEKTETTALAVQMFQQAFIDHGVPTVVHADNGASMRATDTINALEEAGVITSYSRPRVSDDNPFSESLFKTLKYDLTCPTRFHSIDHAREWTAQFLHDYAHHHRHSGLGHYTPASVHDGTDRLVQQKRQATLDAYYKQYPNRFRTAPKAPELPQATGINTHLSQAG